MDNNSETIECEWEVRNDWWSLLVSPVFHAKWRLCYLQCGRRQLACLFNTRDSERPSSLEVGIKGRDRCIVRAVDSYPELLQFSEFRQMLAEHRLIVVQRLPKPRDAPVQTILCRLRVRRNYLEPSEDVLECANYGHDSLEELLNCERLSDVGFLVERRRIPAHRNILAARCPAFAAMLEGRRDASELVVIEDVRHDVFLELLRYIYAGRVRNARAVARELLAVADRYRLEELKAECARVLGGDALSPDEARSSA